MLTVYNYKEIARPAFDTNIIKIVGPSVCKLKSGIGGFLGKI